MPLAYVLQSRPYRETSALLELLTVDAGRIGAVAVRFLPRHGRGHRIAPSDIPDWAIAVGAPAKVVGQRRIAAVRPPA